MSGDAATGMSGLTRDLIAGKVPDDVAEWLRGFDDPFDETHEQLYDLYLRVQKLHVIEDYELSQEVCLRSVEHMYSYIWRNIDGSAPVAPPSVARKRLLSTDKHLEQTLKEIDRLMHLEGDASPLKPFTAAGVSTAVFPPVDRKMLLFMEKHLEQIFKEIDRRMDLEEDGSPLKPFTVEGLLSETSPPVDDAARGGDLYITIKTIKSLRSGIRTTIDADYVGKDGRPLDEARDQFVASMNEMLLELDSDTSTVRHGDILKEFDRIAVGKDYGLTAESFHNRLIKLRRP